MRDAYLAVQHGEDIDVIADFSKTTDTTSITFLIYSFTSLQMSCATLKEKDMAKNAHVNVFGKCTAEC